jgi:hypothetical protein
VGQAVWRFYNTRTGTHFYTISASERDQTIAKYLDLVYEGAVYYAMTDAGGDGAWIPTSAIDQYGATLAQWFGVPAAQLVQVFPNLGAFPAADLGFLR